VFCVGGIGASLMRGVRRHKMTFGDPSDFAVEAESDGAPTSPRGTVWGHMRVWCRGQAVGRFEELHCGLLGAQRELSKIADRLELLASPLLSELTDESAWSFLDTALYVDDDRSDEDVELDAEAWSRHSFLTNSSEAFDGYKGFIFRRDADALRILIKGSDDLLLGFTVTTEGYVSAVRSFERWCKAITDGLN
jgi:hypothetical protein